MIRTLYVRSSDADRCTESFQASIPITVTGIDAVDEHVSYVTSGVNLTENHRFEFPHFAENVDLRRIAGGVWAFSCPTTLVATCTLDRRPR